MVKFKSWRDSYLFLKEYGSFTCLQCKGCNHNLDMSVEHSDSEYARFFCTKTISMVRLDFQFVCPEWENENGDKITDEDEKNGEWSIDEIRELVNEYEEVTE